ncbi:MAG: UDP-N-acetylmuramate--L-alanine ligase [Bacteroidales bacterium]|nr:UDP-N-acetylmuramate--L-alanine ligase [Bacteroidales bacterium]
MNKALHTSTIYLIGIGGIGMSALARYFRQQGKEVSGYDRVSTALSRQLESEGMNIHYDDDPAYVPCDAGLVIYTPAIPESNRQLTYCREFDVPVKKRAEVLEMIAEDHKTIAIAGTHGKTSISSMVAHIMKSSAFPVNAFIGGIMSNYDSNMLRDEQSEYLLAEADEYDRSFLRLHPHIAVVSAIAADHLDIYGSHERLREAFSAFLSQVNEDGKVIVNENIATQIALPPNSIIYGTGSKAALRIENVKVMNHHFQFDFCHDNLRTNIEMRVPGRHNIENACAAAGVCLELGLNDTQIKAGLESYRGVKRRFEYIINEETLVYVDDYAHHPDEITACTGTAKELYPGRHITGIFQPHLYSRTRDFAEGFAASLETLDEIILLDIYPAREEPIEGVNTRLIFDKIKNKNKQLCTKETLAGALMKGKTEVVISMGAGDIDQLVEPIKEILLRK